MRWIPAGEFTMGTDSSNSQVNERPAHRVRLEGFWIDETPVTNAQFARFVKATGYETTAERAPVWEELKKQLPPGTPKPDPSQLVPGSLVYSPPAQPVPLDDMESSWSAESVIESGASLAPAGAAVEVAGGGSCARRIASGAARTPASVAARTVPPKPRHRPRRV